MATVSAKVFEHHQKTDGTYNVKICIHHKDQRRYIDTNHFVVKKQLTKGLKIKDPFVADKVEQQLRDYRKIISESAPPTKNRNNTLEEVLTIASCITAPGSRAELAKELYILLFFLCGINAVDLYQLNPQDIRNGRIDYNRSKTKGKRKDNAFISIKVIDEAKPLLEKYIGNLAQRYSGIGCLNKALSKGMEQVCRLTGLSGITFYWARHTFASVARNDCRMSKDDVALALNHVDEGNRTTDIYIAKDWKIVDDVQRKVVAQLRKTGNKLMKKIQKKNETQGIAA